MVHSSYRYVTRRLDGNKSRKAPGWYVQGPGSKVLQGPYEDEVQAAASIAKTLKVKPASLLRSQVPGHQVRDEAAVSFYRHVTKRVLRDNIYWVGQPKKGRQKLFKDMVKAANWVARQRKTSTTVISKGKALHGRRQYQIRLATVLRIYGDGSEVPGDTEYLRSHAVSMEAIVEEEPAIEILDVQSKYGPFRKLLTQTSKRIPLLSTVHRSKVFVKNLHVEYKPALPSKILDLEKRFGVDTILRAYRLLAVLRKTIHAVEGKDFAPWVTNCGRNVSHHSGFVPMLLRFKLLRKVSRSTVSSLDLGSATGRRYELRSNNLVEVLGKLSQLIKLADAIKQKMSSVPGPTSCSAWSKAFRKLSEVVQDNPCPGMRDVKSYVPLWTMRAILLRRMYASGVSRLRLDASSWSEFAATFPDQKKMFEKVVSQPLTCKAAMQESEYTGPAELMAMYLCFLGAVDHTSTGYLVKHEVTLKKARTDYKKENHQNPVLKELLGIVKARQQK